MAAHRRPLVLATCLLMGFVAILAVRSRSADPSSRLPRRFQLAALIERQRQTTTDLQHQVEDLRKQVEQLRAGSAGQSQDVATREARITDASTTAGLSALVGDGLKVTLDDSDLDRSKLDPALKANVNDLVIHSQDVQAVANALRHSGSEAVAVYGQRLANTRAVL